MNNTNTIKKNKSNIKNRISPLEILSPPKNNNKIMITEERDILFIVIMKANNAGMIMYGWVENDQLKDVLA